MKGNANIMIWIIISLPIVAVVFLIDLLLRRKKWSENTTGEKISLIVSMVSVLPHLFLSAFGLLLGILGCGSETAFGKVLYDVTITMAALYFIVALGATIAALILRKVGKTKASIWINVIAIAYFLVVSIINTIAGNLL
jgi:hypothetical protein